MQRNVRVLILAGTTEATELAIALESGPFDVVSSFAGVTEVTRPRPGAIRRGGFGGVDGLADYLRAGSFDAVVDATHPFAAQMPFHAAAAAAAVGVAQVRLLRPGWTEQPGDRWERCADLDAAARHVDGLGPVTVFLAVGRQSVDPFRLCGQARVVLRSIEPLAVPWPDAVCLTERPPFTVPMELALLRDHDVDVVVTKDSGGGDTEAKLTAARELGLQVVVVDRPPSPDVASVSNVPAAVNWLAKLL